MNVKLCDLLFGYLGEDLNLGKKSSIYVVCKGDKSSGGTQKYSFI